MSNGEFFDPVISTDGGIFPLPFMMKWTWGERLKEVEMIGWIWAPALINLFKQAGIKVVSLHSPIGEPVGERPPLDVLKVKALKYLMLSTDEAVRLAESVEYGFWETIRLVSEFTRIRGNRHTQAVIDLGHRAFSLGETMSPNDSVKKTMDDIELTKLNYPNVNIALHVAASFGEDEGGLDFSKVSIHQLKRILKIPYVIENQIVHFRNWYNPLFLWKYRKKTRNFLKQIQAAERDLSQSQI